ncbi:MAG: hypothetical protein QOF18_1891 [Frankiaceae bacterium]|jgi:uncharacterized protein (DUF1697 family)|nr:hypothetical protein [Frankiaceae bacterium]
MSTWVALLRAVNVGGRKLPMADLQRIVTEIGGSDVRTYLQSGNVVFDGPKRVAAALEPALTASCGFEVRVLLRTAAELAAVADQQPFATPRKAWHVTFLASSPTAGAVQALAPDGYGGDEFRVAGREVYLSTPDGYGRTKLNNTFWERKLKTVATTRNWNTVEALRARCDDSRR